jgi:predicted helicase
MLEKTQCFPFYAYSEDGFTRKENITDWALKEFRSHYKNQKITKWDIFYFIYAILHHPEYRSKYAANLRRSLPRIPYAPDFNSFAKAGEKLADFHVNYEAQPEYKLEFIENKKACLSWRVEKVRLSKDKTSLIYNDFLTLSGIPAKAFEYRLGNRSALDWIIDQYQVSTDKRSGILNDPNNPDDPEYIVKLIGKVINVSIKTVDIINDLPKL